MTIMPSELGDYEDVVDTRQSFDTRADIGVTRGVLERLLRYLQGNPIKYFSVSSANFSSPTTLPDEPRARTAVCQVVNQACTYRTDGTQPGSSNEQVMTPGTNFTLYGAETIKGFIFQATGISQCIITVTYYD